MVSLLPPENNVGDKLYIYTSASEHLLFCILYLITSNLINDDINQTNYKEKLYIIYWINFTIYSNINFSKF